MTRQPLPTRRRTAGSARRPSRRCRGLTLVELAVVLAVLTVVMATAMPSLAAFSASNKVVAAKSAFASAIALTRGEAAKRGRPVILQALGNGPTGNEYAGGWELVGDETGDGVAAAGEQRLRKYGALGDGVRLTGSRSLVFNASGALAGLAALEFTACPSGAGAPAGSSGYRITVTPSGVADVSAAANCS